MSGNGSITTWRAAALIGRGVAIELIRRRDLAVLAILMLLYLAGMGATAAIGVEDEATMAFMLNLGLTLAVLSAQIVALALAVRQFPDELEARTLQPLLARPVERHAVVLGKWGACTLAGTLVAYGLIALSWLPAPWKQIGHGATFAQALALLPLAMALLCAFGLALSLLLPRGVALLVSIVVLLAGGQIVALARRAADATAFAGAAAWVGAYLPDFAKLNLLTRYTDGIPPLGASTFAGLALYAAILTGAALLAAVALFERKRL